MNLNLNFQDLHTLKRSDIINYFSFYDKNGNFLSNTANVEILSDGQFGDLTLIEPDSGDTIILHNTEYDYTRESVFVLGVGYLIPGDIIRLHLLDKRFYEVKYGWHTNVSNQTIHSWYLVPINYNEVTKEVAYLTQSAILTLYKEYLDTIEVVEYKRNRSTFYIGGEPNND